MFTVYGCQDNLGEGKYMFLKSLINYMALYVMAKCRYSRPLIIIMNRFCILTNDLELFRNDNVTKCERIDWILAVRNS